MRNQTGEVTWRGAVPVSARFDDPYYSLEDGLAEARHVFLAGNDLPARFRAGFHIAELGLGTGLNLLAALDAWRTAGCAGPLRYTGFEAFPLAPRHLARAHAAFPELRPLSEELRAIWPDLLATGAARLPDLDLRMVQGDARDTLPRWAERADAWFLDGFAPARNPELWQPVLLSEVAARTAPAGTAATYSAAGHVRRALAAAGFHVTRVPGHGRKRHMTRACRTPAPVAP